MEIYIYIYIFVEIYIYVEKKKYRNGKQIEDFQGFCVCVYMNGVWWQQKLLNSKDRIREGATAVLFLIIYFMKKKIKQISITKS